MQKLHVRLCDLIFDFKSRLSQLWTFGYCLVQHIVFCYVLYSPVMAIVTPHNCTSGKVIGFVVVIVLVVVVDTNFGISQHQCTCATCRRHIEVATGGKLVDTSQAAALYFLVLFHTKWS